MLLEVFDGTWKQCQTRYKYKHLYKTSKTKVLVQNQTQCWQTQSQISGDHAHVENNLFIDTFNLINDCLTLKIPNKVSKKTQTYDIETEMELTPNNKNVQHVHITGTT